MHNIFQNICSGNKSGAVNSNVIFSSRVHVLYRGISVFWTHTASYSHFMSTWLWTVCPWHEPISPRVLLCSDSSTCLWPVPGLGHVPERVSGPRLGTWTASHLWSLWSVERVQNYWVPLMTARAWPASPQTAASK